MARDGTGVYSQVGGDFATGQVIDASVFNTKLTDIANALTQSASRDGQGAMTGALPMGNNRITGMAAGAVRTDAAQVAQIQDGGPVWAGTTGGTATAITGTVSPTITAYATGMRIAFKVGTSCGAAPTLNLNAVGAKKIYVQSIAGTVQAGAGALLAGTLVDVIYDASLDSAAGGFVLAALAMGWTPISRVSASAAAAVDFTLPSAATQFRLHFWAAQLSNAADIQLRCGVGATFDAGASDYQFGITTEQGTSVVRAAATGTDIRVAATVLATQPGNSGLIHFTPGTASTQFQARCEAAIYSSTSLEQNSVSAGRRNATGAKTSIRILPSAGTLTAEFLLEGLV